MRATLHLLTLCALLQLCTAFQPGAWAARPVSTTRAAHTRMAGFGASAPKKGGGKKKGGAKKAGTSGTQVSPKRQWDIFKELVSSGEKRTAVFAQLDGKWTEGGDVAVSPPATAAQAAQVNKRLILEHAPRVKPALQLRAKELVAGVLGADGEPELLTKQEVPEGIVCGFEGAADASGMYAKVRGTTKNSDPTAIMGSAAR